MSETNQYTQDLIALHELAHRQLREALDGLNDEAVNWTPGPDTSSIGTIITHAIGADVEVLRNVLHVPTSRDRDAEFAAQDHRIDNLRELIQAAEADWQELAPRLGEHELSTKHPRPNRPEVETGLFWLARNVAHLREHLAQIWLTKQLYLNIER